MAVSIRYVGYLNCVSPGCNLYIEYMKHRIDPPGHYKSRISQLKLHLTRHPPQLPTHLLRYNNMSSSPSKPKNSFKDFLRRFKKTPTGSSRGFGAPSNPPPNIEFKVPATYGDYLRAGGPPAPSNLRVPISLREPDLRNAYIYYAEPDHR